MPWFPHEIDKAYNRGTPSPSPESSERATKGMNGIQEYDSAGTLRATYICRSTKGHGGSDGERVDVILPPGGNGGVKGWAWAMEWMRDAFLPAGFPDSVGHDYLRYQIFDSLQAFASAIAGLLASRAVLEGVGVGNPTQTPQAALLLSITQDTLSRLATIFFAARFGTAIEPECKMYRLLADIFNDVAMVLDCLNPVFPYNIRVGVLAGSSVLRALCGVAAGSAKGCLSAHFARRGNLGEVAAKDSSQETVISLAGMLVGTLVVSKVTSAAATWSALILLLTVHLLMNYLAVQAVCMRSLNRQRANIFFSTRALGDLPSPARVAQRERIFNNDGALQAIGRQGTEHLGHCQIGVSMQQLVKAMGRRQPLSGAFQLSEVHLFDLTEIYSEEQYLVWFDYDTRKAFIALKQDATPIDQLKAWRQALMIAGQAHDESKKGGAEWKPLEELRNALRDNINFFENNQDKMVRVGWDLGVAALETRPGWRIKLK